MKINSMKSQIQPRFYEYDAYGRANNMFYLSWCEIGRFDVAREAGLLNEDIFKKYQFVVNSANIDFCAPVLPGENVLCETFIKNIKASQIEFVHLIKNPLNKKIFAKANTKVVVVENNILLLNMPEEIQICINNYIEKYQKGFTE